eukprot:869051_1
MYSSVRSLLRRLRIRIREPNLDLPRREENFIESVGLSARNDSPPIDDSSLSDDKLPSPVVEVCAWCVYLFVLCIHAHSEKRGSLQATLLKVGSGTKASHTTRGKIYCRRSFNLSSSKSARGWITCTRAHVLLRTSDDTKKFARVFTAEALSEVGSLTLGKTTGRVRFIEDISEDPSLDEKEVEEEKCPENSDFNDQPLIGEQKQLHIFGFSDTIYSVHVQKGIAEIYGFESNFSSSAVWKHVSRTPLPVQLPSVGDSPRYRQLTDEDEDSHDVLPEFSESSECVFMKVPAEKGGAGAAGECFTHTGKVVAWSVYTVRPGDLSAFVLRPVGGDRYMIVGENMFQTSGYGAETVVIPEHQRIAVLPGDLIGWQTISIREVPRRVHADRTDELSQDCFLVSLSDTGGGKVRVVQMFCSESAVGQVLAFPESGEKTLTCSIEAHIEPDTVTGASGQGGQGHTGQSVHKPLVSTDTLSACTIYSDGQSVVVLNTVKNSTEDQLFVSTFPLTARTTKQVYQGDPQVTISARASLYRVAAATGALAMCFDPESNCMFHVEVAEPKRRGLEFSTVTIGRWSNKNPPPGHEFITTPTSVLDSVRTFETSDTSPTVNDIVLTLVHVLAGSLKSVASDPEFVTEDMLLDPVSGDTMAIILDIFEMDKSCLADFEVAYIDFVLVKLANFVMAVTKRPEFQHGIDSVHVSPSHITRLKTGLLARMRVPGVRAACAEALATLLLDSRAGAESSRHVGISGGSEVNVSSSCEALEIFCGFLDGKSNLFGDCDDQDCILPLAKRLSDPVVIRSFVTDTLSPQKLLTYVARLLKSANRDFESNRTDSPLGRAVMAVLEAIHDSVLCFWLRKNVSELEKYVLMILDACTDTIAPVVAHLKAAGSEKASQCSVDLRGSVALRLLPGLILVTAATMHTDPESAATEIGSNFPPPPPSDRPLSLRLSDLQQSATSEALRVFFKERADVDGKRVRTVVVDGVGGGWVSFSEEAALQSVMDCEKSIDGHPFSAEPYDFYRTGLSGFSISDEVATKLGLILRHLDFICKQTPSILQSEKTFIQQTVDASQFIQNTLIVQTIHPVHSNYLTSNITVSIPGVSCLKLNFSPKCRTSRNNDSLKLYRGPGMINHVDGTDYSGDMGGPVGFPVDTVKIDGDSVVFSHTQDSGCEYWGYKCTVTGHFPTIIPELPLILDVLKTISWTLGLYASRLISHESSVAVDDVSLEKLLDSKLFSGGISLEGRESDIRTDSPKTMERRDSEQKLLSSIAEGTGPGKRILELLNPNSGKNIFKRLNRMQFAGRLYADEVHSCERLFIATLIKHCRLVDVCQRLSSRNDAILPSSLSKIVTIIQRYQRWILLQHQILGKEGPASTENHSLQSTDANGTRSFPSFVRSLYDKLTFVMQTRAAAEVMVFSLDVPVLHRLFSMEMKTSAPPICIGVTDPRSRWRKVLCIVKPAVKLMLILKTTRLVRFQLFQSSRTFASEDAAIELLSFVQSPNLTRARIFHFLRRRARVVDKRARGYRLRAGVLRTASLASVKCQVLEAESEGGTGQRCHYLTGMGTTDDVLTSRVMFAFESFFKAVFDGLTDFGKEVNELVCNDPGSIDLAFVLLKSLELEFKKSDLHIFTRMQVFPKMFEMLIAVNAAVSSYKDVPESPDSSYTAAKLSKLMVAIWSTVNRILRTCLGLCTPETGSGGPGYETEIPLSARPPLSKDHAQLVKNIVRSAVFQLDNVRDLNIRVVLHELIYDISCFHIVTPYLAKPNTLEKLLKALDF